MDDDRTEVFVPLTGEDRFWVERAPCLFAPVGGPHWLARLWHHVTVTPRAHVTFLNATYQIYLNHIFHTTLLARVGHSICIPLNVILLFYGLAQFRLAGAPPEAHAFLPFEPTAGLLLAGALFAWYASVARRLASPLLAVICAAWIAGSSAVGTGLYHLAFTLEPAARTWWMPTPWYLAPLFWMGVVSSVQAWSHITEPLVPPRANGTDRWIAVEDYVHGRSSPNESLLRRALRGATVFMGSVWGTIDEWWASAKLLPYFLLEGLWLAGYRRDQREAFRALARRARASGNPALDWVGVGGGRFVSDLPPGA